MEQTGSAIDRYVGAVRKDVHLNRMHSRIYSFPEQGGKEGRAMKVDRVKKNLLPFITVPSAHKSQASKCNCNFMRSWVNIRASGLRAWKALADALG